MTHGFTFDAELSAFVFGCLLWWWVVMGVGVAMRGTRPRPPQNQIRSKRGMQSPTQETAKIAQVHGGGWLSGDKRGARAQPLLRTLRERGWVVVAINFVSVCVCVCVCVCVRARARACVCLVLWFVHRPACAQRPTFER
jgi:hypothetical protein